MNSRIERNYENQIWKLLEFSLIRDKQKYRTYFYDYIDNLKKELKQKKENKIFIKFANFAKNYKKEVLIFFELCFFLNLLFFANFANFDKNKSNFDFVINTEKKLEIRKKEKKLI